MEVRAAAVAGQFYPENKKELEEMLKECFLNSKFGPGKLPEIGKERKIFGLIVPHAGYVYSGYTAAHAYYELAKDGKPEIVVIIGPNHYGYGYPISTLSKDWETPLGRIKIDKELVEELVKREIADDELAHRYEHSIEVQLPFLQFIFKDFKFVPICMLDQSFKTAQKLSEILFEVLKNKDFVVIASSDFSHFEPNEIAYQKDEIALEKIKKIDAKDFWYTVNTKNISVCGYGCITTLLLLAEKLQLKSKVLKYMTSGDVIGDKANVVGYAAVKFFK